MVYSEVLEYEPMNWFLEALKKFRPPMEVEMSKDFILFIRNLLIHFPYFKSWNEVRVSKDLVNWSKPARSIDKFLSRVAGKDEFKCRIWDAQKKTMTYCAVKFPKAYENDGTEIYLKDMLSEKEGITFCMSIMFRVLASQVESITS